MIQTMTLSSVVMSGPPMSRSGPSVSIKDAVYRRVILSNSVVESFFGSQTIPPWAPPNGILTTAHFQAAKRDSD